MSPAKDLTFCVEPWRGLWAVVDYGIPSRPARIAQYNKRENAERHAARSQEKWG